MNVTTSRRRALSAAKVYLEMRGYTIVEQEWRRSRSTIDIVAQKAAVIYFVEVKYLASDLSHEAITSITNSKIQAMNYAAETWLEENKWHGQYVHATVEIAGEDYSILSFIENVT